MFAAALVAWLVALLGDGTVRNGKRLVLGSPENRALTKAMTIAVGIALDEIPESSRETLAAALNERFAAPPAVVLDGRTRVRTGLILGIEAQLEPLSDPSITPGGRSFLDEIGIDSAWLCDELVDLVIRSIEQVGPSFPALTPLLTQLNADAIIDRVDVAIEMIGAAQRESRHGSAGPPGRSMGDRQAANREDLPGDWIERLTEAFLEVPAVADDNSRQTIFDMLPAKFRNSIPRSRFPRVQVLEMIRTSANYSGGLKSLLGAVRIVEGDSLAMGRLDDLILELDASSTAAPGAPAEAR